MNWGKVLAYAMVVLCEASAVGYLWVHDWRRGLYWLFAGVMTVIVTI